MAVEK